jgi:hypothetical protein
MSPAPASLHGWRLEIELQDRGKRRTVSLDFDDRAALEPQLIQFRYREVRPVGRLLEFTNEAGVRLAIVAAAYVGHSITEL